MSGAYLKHFKIFLAGLSMMLAACQFMQAAAPAATELQGVWRVTALANESPAGVSRAHLEFSEQPRLTGNAGCNRFFGIYEYREGDLMIDETLGASKMLCQPSVMALENQLLSLLPLSRQAYLEEGRLELRDSRGRLLIAAQREPNP